MKRLFAVLLALAALIPAACAVTKDEIAEELGVVQFDKLTHVEKVEVSTIDTLHHFDMSGDSELSYCDSGDWFTTDGILSEIEADMNGDDINEYIAIYMSPIGSENYDELRMRLYAGEEDALSLVADLPLPGNFHTYNEITTTVRLVSTREGTFICGASNFFWDGGGNTLSIVVYGYDGKECYALLCAEAINLYQGDYVLAENASQAEVIELILKDGTFAIDKLVELGADFSYVDSDYSGELVYSDAGFCEVKDRLEPLGLDLDLSHAANWHTVEDILGGEILMFQGWIGRDLYRLSITGSVADEQASIYPARIFSISDDPDHEIVPESWTRKLTKAELSGCDKELLGYIRNEILARHGYPFTKEKYQEYFGGKNWYEISEDFSYGDLSAVESANVELIQSLE